MHIRCGTLDKEKHYQITEIFIKSHVINLYLLYLYILGIIILGQGFSVLLVGWSNPRLSPE